MKIRTVEYSGTLVAPDAPLPGTLPQIAFAGRSNVGKSSLINTLLRRTRKKIARVSAEPGKTRALNFFTVNDEFFLVDLPGYGYAKVPGPVRDSWRTLVEGFLARPDGPRAVVQLIDARHKPQDDDVRMLAYLSDMGLPVPVALTKIDKLNRSERSRRIPELLEQLGLAPDQVVPFSSKTGEGREELLGALASLLGATPEDPEPGPGATDAPSPPGPPNPV
jgi:GTP-binding protein